MGNVNGREEIGQSGVDGVGVQETMDARDGEFMGQSPPSSPRASHSPLMFRPQVSSWPKKKKWRGCFFFGFFWLIVVLGCLFWC